MTTEQIRWTSSHISSCDTPQSDFVISFSYFEDFERIKKFSELFANLAPSIQKL